MLTPQLRTTLVALAVCAGFGSVAQAAQPSTPPAKKDQAPISQEQRNLTLVQILLREKRPALACQLLQDPSHFDGYEYERLTLLGQCSFELGQRKKAIDYYHQAITLAPQSPQPRAELATVYLSMGQKAKAAELYAETAHLNGPNEASELMRVIAERLRENNPAILAGHPTNKPWSVQLYADTVYDDNANIGPASRTIDVILGGVPVTFELAPSSSPQSSWGINIGLNGNYVVPLSRKFSLFFQEGYANTRYFSQSDFSNDELSVATALVYRDRGFSASLQPSIRYIRLADHLDESDPGLGTQLSQYLSHGLSLTASAGYFKRYVHLGDGQDAAARYGGVGLSERVNQYLQFGGNYFWQRENADDDVYSRRLNGPSLFASYWITPAFSLTANYSYTHIVYDQRMALFADARADRRKIASLTGLYDLSRWVKHRLVLRMQYTNINNASNIDFNRYRRNIFSLGLQTRF